MQRFKHLHFILGVLVLCLSFQTLSAQEGDNKVGEKLFKQHCASCHKLDKEYIGPKLSGVTEKYPIEFIQKWVINNKALIDAGDPTALEVSKLKESEMTVFEGTLEIADVNNIIAYIKNPPVKEVPKKAEAVVSNGGMDKSVAQALFLGALFILVTLLVILAKLFSLVKIVKKDDALGVEEDENLITFGEKISLFFEKNQWAVYLLALFLIFGGLKTKWDVLTAIDVNQEYKPTQPIDFSHKIHAGVNQIDCQYCHSSAKHSKHSGIPSLNVCMNCHKAISEYTGKDVTATDEEKKYYTGEIQKIYKHIGWDPDKLQYTGKQTPIEWVKVHNLQDFVYFNHSQHVTAGNVECQTCHGQVEEMDVLEQHAPLTMGWCINCHRETEIDVQSNEYYEKIHEKLKANGYKGADKPTVQLIGGMECGKCHY